ncbi:unnamed protein product, partial [marine sediment metagenome]
MVGAHPDGIQIFRSIDGLIIRNNIMYDNHQNIFLQPLSGEVMKNIEIYNNLIYHDDYDYEWPKGIWLDCGYGGAPGSMHNVKIYNNTVVSMFFGITWRGNITDVELRNNIIANRTGVNLGMGDSSHNMSSDYNFFSNLNRIRIDWDGKTYWDHLSDYQSETGQDLH